jgi:hypothetical protein
MRAFALTTDIGCEIAFFGPGSRVPGDDTARDRHVVRIARGAAVGNSFKICERQKH